MNARTLSVLLLSSASSLALLAATGCGESAAASADAGAAPGSSPSGADAVTVSVARAERRDMPVQIRAVGRAEPPASVVIKPQVSGSVAEVVFAEGDEVKAGDLLLRLDERPFEAELRAAEAHLASDKALAEDAALTQAQLERVEDLMSEREVQRARAAAASAQAQVLADEAAVDLARLSVEYCAIRAPIDGRTGTLAVRQGSIVKAEDTALLRINQMAPMRVAFAVPEKRLREIAQAQARAPLQVEARAGDAPPVRGTLTFIDNAVDVSTGTLRLLATFDNADRALWPGQFVDITLTLSVEPGAVVVPTSAVQAGQAGDFVFVVGPDASVEQRLVRVLGAEGGESVIAEGLTGGETVVTEGHLRLVPGTRVRVEEPAAR